MRAAIELLEIENKKLEKDIALAERIIEQQNSQLEQTNDWIAFVWAGLGFFTVVVAIFSYFQFNKAEKANKKSQKIFNNVKGELDERVKKHFEEVNAERFNKALGTLDSRLEWNRFGQPVLSEFSHLGLNTTQEEELIELLKNEIPYMGEVVDTSSPPADVMSVARSVFDALSGKGSNHKLEQFLLEYYSNTPYGNNMGNHQIQHNGLKYLTKNFSTELYPVLFGMFENIHPDYPIRLHPSSYWLDNFLWQLRKHSPKIFARVINDDAFIQPLINNKAILHYVVQREPFKAAAADPRHYFNEEAIKSSKFLATVQEISKTIPPPASPAGDAPSTK